MAEVIFWPQVPTTYGSTFMPTQEVRATAGAGGAYSLFLRATDGNKPNYPYAFRIEWLDASGNISHTDNISADHGLYLKVPFSAGNVVDNLTKDIGNATYQNSVPLTPEQVDEALSRVLPSNLADSPLVQAAGAQAAENALAEADILVGSESRSPKTGDSRTVRAVDSVGAVSFEATPEGNVRIGDVLVTPTVGWRIIDADGNISMEVKEDGRTYIYDAVFPGPVTGIGSGSNVPVNTLHVCLVVGQSNASGRGLPYGDGMDPEDPRIMEYGAKNRTLRLASVPLDMHDTATGISPATTFARNYLQTQPSNVGVLLVPAAHGGTGFTGAANTLTWTPNAASSAEYDLPALAIAQTLEAIAAAKAAGYKVVVKLILWHQGENNASLSTAGYAAAQDGLRTYLLAGLGTPNLPFVVGQMTPEGFAVTPSKLNVDKAHAATPGRVPYTGFAKSAPGGVNVGETVHFSRVGIEHLGKTYHAAYWQALANIPGSPALQPQNLVAKRTGTTLEVSWDAPPRDLTGTPTYSMDDGAGTAWVIPPSRITSYTLEYKVGAGAWTPVTRAWGMYTVETVTGFPTGAAQVRVVALNESATPSAPAIATVT
ncbi:sialate O-acetylesterase [Pseudarthrobacter sp. MEB009]|uniref:sialate O-acetylesterase n=1 Tax=Pseudarthrobacter sp. MEB009 TaxID=3040326 RepID=UPI0025578747|nr:sialate O-acetylesterase [Pseudarthrobacter sp. MEB009]